MKKILTFGIMLVFLLMTISSANEVYLEKQTIKPMSFGNTLYVGGNGPGNYTNIQDAIDNATDGDTVFVYNGTYGLFYYTIIINKSINLIGENKFNTIINGSGIGVNVSEVLISGFTLQNNSGIFIYKSNNITIDGNIINDYSSVLMSYSNNNIVTNNSFFNCGLQLLGYNNLVYNNTVNDKPLVYLERTSDKVIDNAGQVILIDCSNVTINNLELSNVDIGIQLYECTNCHIVSNSLSYTVGVGIIIENSTSNTILGNIFLNIGAGLLFIFGEDNNISGNHFETEFLNVGLIFSNNNLFSKNNFIFNRTILLYYLRKNIFSIDSDNKWEGNYWNRARLLPVLIWGTRIIKIIYRNIPWLDIDWHPANEPYVI